jgi:sulfur-oxidizing protein SoxY
MGRQADFAAHKPVLWAPTPQTARMRRSQEVLQSFPESKQALWVLEAHGCFAKKSCVVIPRRLRARSEEMRRKIKEILMQTRRKTLAQGAVVTGLLAATGLFPSYALAFGRYNQQAFGAKNLADAFKALGVGVPTESKDVVLVAPEVAENSAVVALSASASLPGVQHILFLVEKNPAVLVAAFEVSDRVEANFAIRSKMAESSNVYAVALLRDGKAFFAKKEVKVTLGGCGG